MSTATRPSRYFTPPPAAEPIIGDRLAAMEEAREGTKTALLGIDLAAHLARLDAVRVQFMATFAAMSRADFTRIRALPQYDVTPQWVVHHVLQHEAEHRGENGYNRLLAGAADSAQ